MQLHLSTWQDVEAYLERSQTIVIPIGSTEQHGPNGLLGTDALCPEIIARATGDDCGVLVAPTFNVGIAQHHMAFAGSMCLRPSTMIALMCDWADSLIHHGFRKLYWLNGHGGNTATIQAAFAEIYHRYSLREKSGGEELRCVLRNWWELPGVFDLCKELYPTGHGAHATASEVSVTFYAYPEAQKQVEMSPKIAPMGTFTTADNYRKKFPDGRIGSDPSQSNPQDGEKLVKAAALGLAKEVAKL